MPRLASNTSPGPHMTNRFFGPGTRPKPQFLSGRVVQRNLAVCHLMWYPGLEAGDVIPYVPQVSAHRQRMLARH